MAGEMPPHCYVRLQRHRRKRADGDTSHRMPDLTDFSIACLSDQSGSIVNSCIRLAILTPCAVRTRGVTDGGAPTYPRFPRKFTPGASPTLLRTATCWQERANRR